MRGADWLPEISKSQFAKLWPIRNLNRKSEMMLASVQGVRSARSNLRTLVKAHGRAFGSVPPPVERLYPSHVPISQSMKAFMGARAAVMAFCEPTRGDMIAALGETTGLVAIKRMHTLMQADAVGRQLLEEKPRVKEHTIHLEQLRQYPEGSFGRAYFNFMNHNEFSPDGRDDVKYVDDAELAYVMQRYREVHDFLHVLVGLPPTVLGELGLKWMEMVQFQLPMTALSSFCGPFILTPEDRLLLMRVYVPWAVVTGAQAKFLLNVRYEDELATPLVELRQRLNITPAPELPPSQ